MVHYAVSDARWLNIGTGTPHAGQYTASSGTYSFGTSGLASANLAVNIDYWTPLAGGTTEWWYKIAYVDDNGGVTQASSAIHITNGAATLGEPAAAPWGSGATANVLIGPLFQPGRLAAASTVRLMVPTIPWSRAYHSTTS